jgi:AAA15 family ATPase/GTPase
MYLDSLQIQNFRKFGESDNTICFLGGSGQIDIAKSSTLIIGKNNSGKTTIARALDFILKSCQPIVNPR